MDHPCLAVRKATLRTIAGVGAMANRPASQQAALDAAAPPGSAMPADAVPVPGLSVLIWFSNATSAPISD
ncbi:hypothetical protein FA04_18605 [Ensifer adhaerens]|nr:hypothetical protein FA04_18605 [Ensifer adhaerens]KDP70783.1 hypothetical protein FA04_26865 [Ensifer adhaerens]KQX04700.1 hypothetical protein ASD01_12135 [Ensifer sp. Root423]KQZ51233.1 hypothetical protein ASD63_06430 [Ensifer sp. Root558]